MQTFGATIEQTRLKVRGDCRGATRGDRALAGEPHRDERPVGPLDRVAERRGCCPEARVHVSIDAAKKVLDRTAMEDSR